MQEDFKGKSVAELRTLAKSMGLRGISTLRKDELVSLITGAIGEKEQDITESIDSSAAEADEGLGVSENSRDGEAKATYGIRRTADQGDESYDGDGASDGASADYIQDGDDAFDDVGGQSGRQMSGTARFNGKVINKKKVHFSRSVNPSYYSDSGKNNNIKGGMQDRDAEDRSPYGGQVGYRQDQPQNVRQDVQQDYRQQDSRQSVQRDYPLRSYGRDYAQKTYGRSDLQRDNQRDYGQRTYGRQDNQRDYGQRSYGRQDSQRDYGSRSYGRQNSQRDYWQQPYSRQDSQQDGYMRQDQRDYVRQDSQQDGYVRGQRDYVRQDAQQGIYGREGIRDNSRQDGTQRDSLRGPQRDFGRQDGQQDSYDRVGQRDYTGQQRDNAMNIDGMKGYAQDSPDRMDEQRDMNTRGGRTPVSPEDIRALDSGQVTEGLLEVMQEGGYGFIRSNNYMPGENDIYVSPSQIRRFNLKTGDYVAGSVRISTGQEKFPALLFIHSINGQDPEEAVKCKRFESMTPIFPNSRLNLACGDGKLAMRVIDLMAPIGKGQRGMIVSPPKAGKTTLMKQIARGITENHKDMHLIILLIDERPEEVTDIQETVTGDNVEVVFSTFDEAPEHHKRVAEMILGRSKRLVEQGKDVIILLDSLTRLTRAYNLTVTPSGRTLSGGLDPAALFMPKKFFGAARNMKEGGSLTIIATALVDTGSRMDDIVFEEFRGTGNMEVVLDRKLSERRIFPAIELTKSGTRRDDLLLTKEEFESVFLLRRELNGLKSEEAAEKIIDMFARSKSNDEVVEMARKVRFADI